MRSTKHGSKSLISNKFSTRSLIGSRKHRSHHTANFNGGLKKKSNDVHYTQDKVSHENLKYVYEDSKHKPTYDSHGKSNDVDVTLPPIQH